MREFSDWIHKSIINHQNQFRNNFSKDDVRSWFFDMIKGLLISYEKGYLLLSISESILKNDYLKFQLELSQNEVNLLTHSFKEQNSPDRHLGNYHRNLIISGWSVYELLITTLCENVLNQEYKNDLLKYEFNDIKKFLKDNVIEKVESKLTKKHLSHVPIKRKTDKLLSYIKQEYSRDIKKDKDFLEFFGKLRNTMHANFIYIGESEYEYMFQISSFKFIPGQVWRYESEPGSPNLFVNLIHELCCIAYEICIKLNDRDLIPYPDLNAQ